MVASLNRIGDCIGK